LDPCAVILVSTCAAGAARTTAEPGADAVADVWTDGSVTRNATIMLNAVGQFGVLAAPMIVVTPEAAIVVRRLEGRTAD
jgi:hypothetical protein